MGTVLSAILILLVLIAGTRLLKTLIKVINRLFDKVDSWF